VVTWGRFYQYFTSSFAQIPKTQKRLTTKLYFFALLGSARVKAARKMLVKLTPEVVRVTGNDAEMVWAKMTL